MAKVGHSNMRRFVYNVQKFIWAFPDLKYDGSKIICLVCNRDLLTFHKYLCVRHINSATHQRKKSDQRPYTVFICDLLIMLSVCNIPFFILRKEPFRQFWKKYCPTWKLPSQSTVQRHLPSVRERLENNMKSALHNKQLWLAVDETTDSKKHSVANVIVRVLDPRQPSNPYLLASRRLETCTSEAIQRLILTTLHKFQLSRHQVLLFLTDGASVMLSAGRFLKTMCPNLLHITCIVHALHLTAEMVRKCYPDVDALIAYTKAVFRKSPQRIRRFHTQCPGIPEPPQPILTRWGTWLEAAFYYLNHFQNVKSVVLQFNPNESEAVRKSQLYFRNSQVEADLQVIHRNYAHLTDAIHKLETTSLSLSESLQIVDDVKTMLQTLNDDNGIRVRDKLHSVLEKNPDFDRLRHIYSDSADTDALKIFKDHFNYTNITSVDAERSFSAYKNIFSPYRTSLAETTIETYLMLQMFKRANPDF